MQSTKCPHCSRLVGQVVGPVTVSGWYPAEGGFRFVTEATGPHLGKSDSVYCEEHYELRERDEAQAERDYEAHRAARSLADRLAIAL
jgi:hypothetical protein